MVLVTATAGFDHGGRRARGDEFEVSLQQARALRGKGLVRFDEQQADPACAAGETSSASPAAPASPQTTAKASRRGGGKAKASEA
ncbi:hypothetical protein D9M69_525060 [compost metagenome]